MNKIEEIKLKKSYLLWALVFVLLSPTSIFAQSDLEVSKQEGLNLSLHLQFRCAGYAFQAKDHETKLRHLERAYSIGQEWLAVAKADKALGKANLLTNLLDVHGHGQFSDDFVLGSMMRSDFQTAHERAQRNPDGSYKNVAERVENARQGYYRENCHTID